ncbi:pteridine reductase [Rehaibacterium terrae]|jgi:pteridine reductase|uniref:Pteridine reductase n=1 Tax=Rehaibacterium terrae TaxID=1341696 RepID=A0A7W7V7K8_9GAMM|nr:pteridine reductase [Rehaibacterium terrae]MBB5014673.1 pteridine reductase [Rehaibacterium terrae]
MSPARPVVLVTGAAKRIGAAISRHLHAAGCDLALHYRHSAGEMQALVDALEAERPGSTLALQADLADTAALPGLIERTAAHFGRLDGLVNNASTFYATPLGTITEAQWDELFASNAKAPLFLAQAAAPHLRAARGAIVNILDIYAERPLAELAAYAGSKAALTALTKALALSLAPEVRVNGIAPGAVIWPETGKSVDDIRHIIDRTPLGRAGSPDEIADAVQWLLFQAGFMTGEVLRLDGGRCLTL